MKAASALFLCLVLAASALPVLAEGPSIDTAIAVLEKHIARDEEIASRPANIAATRQARQRLGEGLNELQFIINHFESHFGGTDPQMIKDLHRILDEEKAEAGNERYSHRQLESTRDMVVSNLPLKKAILKRARELAGGEGLK